MPVVQRYFEAAAAVGDPPTIDVLFTFMGPGITPGWNITPDSVQMQGNGTIQFTLDSGSSSGAQFAGFGIKSSSPNPDNGTFDHIVIAQQGTRMNVNDNNNVQTGQLPKEYDYYVAVIYNGTTYYSDPKIINDPPPQLYRAVPVKSTDAVTA